MKQHTYNTQALSVLLIGLGALCRPCIVNAVTVSDNFNRANGTVGANWSVSGSLGISSNSLKLTTGSTDSWMSWRATAFGNDHFSQATITTTTAQDNHAVAVRMAPGAKTFYFCDGGAIRYIGKFVNGAHTILKTVTVTIRAGDVLRCEAQGTTIRYIVNGSTITSATDGSLTSGTVGLFLSTSDGKVDDWAGGDLSATPPSPDTIPPTILSITSSNITQAGATIAWSTDEPSDSQVEYGPTTTYGSASTINTSLLSNHSVVLSNLAAGAAYHYRVKSKDAAGNLAASADSAFTTSPPTPPDTTPPSVPTNLQASNSTSNSVSLSWSASTDNTGVTGYRLYRDGVQVATTTAITCGDISLTASTTYAYTVAAFDAAGNPSNQSLSVSATTTGQSASTFPVRISANRRYLVDQNANPFPILGRTAWFVISLPVADYQTFITDSVSRGYNSVEMHVLDHDARGNHPPFAGNGTAPFLKRLDGTSWNGTLGGNAPDFSTPNEAYWSYVDTFLSYCEAQNVLVFMFPAYVGYAGGGQGWMQEMVANGTSRMYSYGVFLSDRYRGQKNLVWMMGGDFGTGSLPFNQAQTDVENALLTGLKSVTPQQSLYFSAEWVRGSIGTDQVTFGQAMTLNSVYANSQGINDLGRRAYSYTPTEPAYLLEEPYDQEGADGNGVNLDATQPVRRFQWWGWLSAIGGYISGNGYVWPFVSPTWQVHLDTQGSRDMSRLNAFVRSIAWSELVPSGLNGMKTLITAGGGNISQDNYVSAAASPAGSLMVAYIGPGHTGSITVDMRAMGATARGRWFNPVDGTYSTIAGSPFPNVGATQFAPPGSNGSGYGDWVLILDTSITPDSSAPTVPSNLQASNVTSNSAVLSWSASADNVAVAGYRLYRNGVQVAQTNQTSTTAVGLSPLTSYAFTVTAYDASNNESAPSQPINVTTTNTGAPPPAVPAFVKLTEARGTASSNMIGTPSFSSAVAGGGLIAVWVWYNSNSQSVSTVTDSVGNPYFKAIGPTTGTGVMGGWRQELWYAKNVIGGSAVSVVATFTGTFSGEKSITAHEFSGLDPVSPLDVMAAAATVSANASTSSVSTNFANELILGAALFQGSGTGGSGFAQRSSMANNVSEDRLVFSPGSYAATFSNGSQSAIVLVAAFKAAGQ